MLLIKKIQLFCIALLVSSVTVNAQILLAPGYSNLSYELPAPGSYRLPPLGQAADSMVLDSNGRSRKLYDIFGDKYVLLNFIYSSCQDVNGCPLAAHVSYQIKAEMRNNPMLAEQLQLVSISFDPEKDTPAVMALYGENFKYAGKAGDWQFLTTESLQSLRPLLKDYQQDIQREYSLDGQRSDEISHLLRVFLIDPARNIRNIYSVAFLHKDTVINDVLTLLQEAGIQEAIAVNPTGTQANSEQVARFGPGDNKQGYESQAYVTRSIDLNRRIGRQLDLFKLVKQPVTGLPPLAFSENQALSPEKIQLGRKLFYDRRLSLNDTFSCAMCHIPEQGFTSNELSIAIGVEGRTGRRNTPTLYNVAFASQLFHDARESALEQQIWGPLLAHNEMANPSVGYVINKIRSFSEYDGLFEQAFEGRGVGMETLGAAIAAYERTLISANSAFDRWHYANDAQALTSRQKAGFKLFNGKAGCSACHLVDEAYALFKDGKLHNTGLGYEYSMGTSSATRRIQLAPGVFVNVDRAIIDELSEPAASDLGYYEVSQDPDDRWKYKTPSLRNISLTAPYMHNGRFTSLKDVVEFYNRGGISNETLDPLIHPLGLDDEEIEQLVAFLHSLSGDNVTELVADAFAAPIGDPQGSSNPE